MSIHSSLAVLSLLLVPAGQADEPATCPLEMTAEARKKHLYADVANVGKTFAKLRAKVHERSERDLERLRVEAYVRAHLDPLTSAGVETLRTLRAELTRLAPDAPPSKATAPIEAKRAELVAALAEHQGLIDAIGLATDRKPLAIEPMLERVSTIFEDVPELTKEDRSRLNTARSYTNRELHSLWISTTVWSRYRTTLRTLKTDAECLAKCPNVTVDVRDRFEEVAARYAQLESLAGKYWAAT